jgi:hypothetical protein
MVPNAQLARDASAPTRFARFVFNAACAWGAVTLLPLPFMRHAIENGLALTHLEYFYGFIGTAIAFQLVFWRVAAAPREFRSLMPACMLEKIAFAGPAVWLVAGGQADPSLLVFAGMDLVFFAMFLAAYLRLARRDGGLAPGRSPQGPGG